LLLEGDEHAEELLSKRLTAAEKLQEASLAELQRFDLSNASDEADPARLAQVIESIDSVNRDYERTQGRLEALLRTLGIDSDGTPIEELDARLSGTSSQLEAASAVVAATSMDTGGAAQTADIESLEIHRDKLRQLKAQAEGEAHRDRDALAFVAEAQEELEAAESEVRTLESLSDVIERATAFIERAQDEVHRDIAPMLKSGVERWLPLVTANRYREVAVDPETLAVKVRDQAGAWRDADQLSHGTCEQVYLLLRIAMIEHFTRGSNESCPLILDGVTSEADSDRKREILEMLCVLARERQIVLFTHEHPVHDWAQERLATPSEQGALSLNMLTI
jgi:hypothetical protein